MAKGARKEGSGKTATDSPQILFSQAQGIDYLYGYFNAVDPWDVTDLDIRKIIKFRENVYAQKIATNLTNMIFQGPPIVNILDTEGNSREDIAEWYRTMLSSELVDFEEKLHRTVDDWLYMGTFLHSDTIEEVEGRILITEIRNLPPETFSDSTYIPADVTGSPELVSYGRVLKGIMRYGDGSVHYWQSQGIKSEEVKNCSHMKAPKFSYFIDGVPLLAPLYKLIPKMNNSWDALMQSENRANALFLRVNKYATLNDNKTTNWSYSNRVLASYNRNVFFTLPPDVEPIELKGPVSDIALNTIDVLTKLMISLYSASDFITKGDGTILGGSNSGETNLFKNTIVGIQTKLIKAWTPILNKILEWNGYIGFTVEIKLPELEFKNEELDFKKGHDIVDAVEKGYVFGSINEVRTFFGLEDASKAFLAASKKEWEDAKLQFENPLLAQMGLAPEGQEKSGEKSESPAANQNKNSGKEENASEEEVNDDQQQLKKNQLILNQQIEEIQENAEREVPSEEELSEVLSQNLEVDVREFFKAVSRIKSPV